MEDLMIVSYLYQRDGTFHATRHVKTCAIFTNVIRQVESSDPTMGGRFPGLCILEEARYACRPGADARPPKDHSCVTKYLAERDAAAPRQKAMSI